MRLNFRKNAMIGVAIGAVLALIGVAMAAMGWSNAPTGRDVMLFQGGMTLLAGGAIALTVGFVMHGTARVEAAVNRLVRIADTPSPPRHAPTPAMQEAQVAEPQFEPAIPAAATIAAAGVATVSVAEAEEPVAEIAATTPDMLPPDLPLPELSLPANEDRWSNAAEASPLPPMPPLPPRIEPVFEPLPTAPEPEPVFAPAVEPVTVHLPEPPAAPAITVEQEAPVFAEPPHVTVQESNPQAPAPEIDPFDLEAAIAAELGLEPVAAAPVEVQPEVSLDDGILLETVPVETAQVEAALPEAANPAYEKPASVALEVPEAAMPELAAVETTELEADTPVAFEPEPEAEPLPVTEEPAGTPKTPIGSHESGGIIYTLYDDGSVTARQGDVEEHFNSLDELRAAFSG
jgi:hypothetical protein